MPRLGLGAANRRRKTLNIAAMPNCEWWIDINRTESITFASGTNVTKVNDLSGKNRHLDKANAGNTTIYPVHVPAERGLLFLNSAFDQMCAGAAGDWNFMHNGNGCSIMMLVKVDSSQPASNAVMLATSSEASSGVGTNLWFYNTNQQYQVTTRNGTGLPFYNTGANNSLTKNVSTILSVHMELRTGSPPDLVTRYNGATDLKLGNLTTFSASNSTGALFVGKLPDAVFKCRMVFKKCAIFSRRITKAEENLILEAWAAEEGISLTRYGEAALAVIGGQSNAKGRGDITGTEFQATPSVTNASIFNSGSFSFAMLQAGTNNDAYDNTKLGLEMKLAQQYTTLSGKPLYLIKGTADGTSMLSWTNDNNNFINLQTAMQRASWFLEDAGYEVKPFFIWYQGETDAQDSTNAAAYQGRLQTFITQIQNLPNFVQCPTYVVQISQSPTYTDTATVQAAQLNISVTTPFSAYVNYVETSDIAVNFDQNHINAASLNAIGMRIAKRRLKIAE